MNDSKNFRHQGIERPFFILSVYQNLVCKLRPFEGKVNASAQTRLRYFGSSTKPYLTPPALPWHGDDVNLVELCYSQERD
ncbi:MAG: hypothetical protein LQ352_007005 [Teloschistes flavicans]|nr:MAG: hypothetical protein LQ352_007005 [Teloschistes flavicans]